MSLNNHNYFASKKVPEKIIPNSVSVLQDEMKRPNQDSFQNASLAAPETSIIIDSLIVKRDDRLDLLALKYYGNKKFWVYIYIDNRKSIPNPEALEVGTKIFIPGLSKYGVDVNDPSSVEKAIEIENKIKSVNF